MFHYWTASGGYACGRKNGGEWMTKRRDLVDCPRCLELLLCSPTPAT